MKSTAHIHSLSSNLIPLILLGSVFSNANAATVTSVGVEEGGAGNSYSVQNWSNAGVAKVYDLGGTERYGTAGYYQIRPIADPASTTIGSAVGGSNDLGISEGTNPTLYSAPTILSSITGAAGTYVNYGGYGTYRGPDGSALYRTGGLSVSVSNGPFNTPAGSNNGYFGSAFSFTMGMSATFRMGIAVDSVGSGLYAPDYISVFNSGTGSVFSSAMARNGSADMAFFDIDAVVGETFSTAMWQLAGTQSVSPFSLVTFDVSQFKFDAATGSTTSSSTALTGTAAGVSTTGAGTVSLTANNTYGGATTVGNGTLELGGAGRLGGGSYSANVSLATSNSSLRIATSANQTLSGAISGSGSLAKSGNGTLTLSGSSSYTGNTTISGGTVIASNANALGNTAGAVTANNGGTLDVRANITRNGTVSIDAAVLTGGGSAVALTNNGSGFELKNGSAMAGAVTLAGTGGLTVSGNRSIIWNSGHTYTGATVIASGGDLALAGAGALSAATAVNNSGVLLINNKDQTLGGLSGASTGRVIGSNSYSLTVNRASGNDSYSGTIESVGALIKDGAGDLVLSGNNTYAGNTTVNAGRLAVASANALGTTAGVTTVASGAQLRLDGVTVGNETLTISGTGLSAGANVAGALRSANGTSNTWQGKINLAADARIFSGSSTSLTVDVASGDAINLGAFNLNIDGAGTHTVNDAIVGTGGLIKTGSGVTTFSAVNSYSGATDIQAGRVVLSGAGRLGSGAISVANASTGTLEFAVTGANTMANNISGNGSLLSSSGETRFTGAVTSTGGLTINSNSAVRIGNGGTTGSYSGNTVLGNSAAQLIFDRSDSYIHAGSISGNGSVLIAGAGTTTLSGTNSYTGLTTVSGGTLAVNGSVAGAMTVASGATLQGSGTISGATTVSGNLNPGNSPGLLTFANSLTLDSTAITTMEITGAARGTEYDAINVGGSLTYGGTLILDFSGETYTEGVYSFNLFDFVGSSGGFSDMSLAGIYSGSFTDNSGIWGLTDGDNNWSFNQGDGVLTFTVVPEPNVAMVAGSLALMAMLRRRRD
ncbi:MAG: beta strand repeat-containing protein [Verrucomicrobiota bacterium]